MTVENAARRTAGLDGLDLVPGPDQVAIGTTLGLLQRGFTTRDSRLLLDVYADDADWVNAFGSVKRGRDDIVDYLRGLFADDNFNAGTLAGPPVSRLRRLGDDAVVVSTRLAIRGQLLLDGEPIEVRDNHSVRVLERQPDGRWLIVSEMYMDARTDESYAGHS